MTPSCVLLMLVSVPPCLTLAQGRDGTVWSAGLNGQICRWSLHDFTPLMKVRASVMLVT